jgi:methionyl-tRNA synthetase
LPYDVPSNEYLNMEGKKLSTSRNWAIWAPDLLERFDPDPLRFYLAFIAPESRDTDFTFEDFVRRNNDELVATWGNLVNRVLSMSDRNFEGKVPDPGELNDVDREIVAMGPKTLETVGDHIEKVELRAGLRSAMDAATEVNAYLNATEPWRVIKDDPVRGGTILWVAIQAIAAIRVALYPYMPHSAETIGEMLGIGPGVTAWFAEEVPGGTELGAVGPVFIKLEDDIFED